MEQRSISIRASQQLQNQPISRIIEQNAYLESKNDTYHYKENKNGYLILSVAENKLNWHRMKQKIIQTMNDIPDWVVRYGPNRGSDELRKLFANMMQNTWVQCPVDFNSLTIQNGCHATIDSVAWCLCDQNDSVITIGPVYSGFENDLFRRARANLVISSCNDDYSINFVDLNQKYEQCLKRNQPAKMFLLCQPCNPTGLQFDKENLTKIIDWALSKGLHFVSDEIYGNSCFPQYDALSVAQIMKNKNPTLPNYLGNHVHIVAGLSKDFGMAGMRVGYLFSHNQMLHQEVGNLGNFQSLSQLTQYSLIQVFKDQEFIKSFITENRQKLYECYQALKDALQSVNVPLTPAIGTLTAWADFRLKLKEQSFESESQLWKQLFDNSKILVISGQSCNHKIPGFFRICYSYPSVPSNDITIAMKELKSRLQKQFLLSKI